MESQPPRPPLDATVLRDGLAGPGLPWRSLDVIAETGSTNADVLAYRWDFGDGSVPPNSRSLNRTWNTAGD